MSDASAVPVLELREEDDIEENAVAEPFNGRNARLELTDIAEEEGDEREKVRWCERLHRDADMMIQCLWVVWHRLASHCLLLVHSVCFIWDIY